jgi:hypothetical protein
MHELVVRARQLASAFFKDCSGGANLSKGPFSPCSPPQDSMQSSTAGLSYLGGSGGMPPENLLILGL